MKQHNHTSRDVGRVLDFWFGEMTDGFCSAATRRRWFAAEPAFDREIVTQFAHLLEGAARGDLTAWLDDPRGSLAFVIVTDQFSRQIHRGSPAAFATDALARAAARAGIERGDDRSLSIDQRSFFYLPFEHSESKVDQHTSVALFAQLVEDTAQEHRAIAEESLRFARGHREIVMRFGRFQHRNACLGRTSSEAELEFLRKASRFGQ
jgi:uncharacterized protein (DUF924 family)